MSRTTWHPWPVVRFRDKLLWIDGSGGAIVGLAMLGASGWLSDLYRLPHDFVLLVGWVNLAYGVYALSLARRARRPMSLVVLLIVANLTWAAMCFRWVFAFRQEAGPLGLAHLAAEGAYVGALACLEWRWRERLRTA